MIKPGKYPNDQAEFARTNNIMGWSFIELEKGIRKRT